MSDRPTASELVEATREFLEREVLPAASDGRLRFRTLVAINALGIAQRELESAEEEVLSPEEAAGLARRIRAGDVPDGALPLLRRHVAAKLRVANPGYLDRYREGSPNRPFVPSEFDVPLVLATERFRLEPLGPQHNESDHAAWSSSLEHIRATPGWAASPWPSERSLEENLRDLQGHADDFRNRTGFTYTVLDPASGDVIGCVYIYPGRDGQHDADVHSWVTAGRADLDAPLWRAVSDWLAGEWPFERVAYAERS